MPTPLSREAKWWLAPLIAAIILGGMGYAVFITDRREKTERERQHDELNRLSIERYDKATRQ